MTQTTQTPDPRTQMPLAAIDDLQRRVMLSLVAPENHRVDQRALRALPTWRGVVWARIAFMCKALDRRELDLINHEAAFGGVKPDKRPGPVVTDAAVETLCTGLYGGWDVAEEEWRAERRKAVRGLLLAAVQRLDWSELIPDLDQLADAIADPGTVVRPVKNESGPRWTARAVTQVIRGKLFA